LGVEPTAVTKARLLVYMMVKIMALYLRRDLLFTYVCRADPPLYCPLSAGQELG